MNNAIQTNEEEDAMLNEKEQDAIWNYGGPKDVLLADAYEAVKRASRTDEQFRAFLAHLLNRIERLEEHTKIPRRNASDYDEIDEAILQKANDS